PCERPPPRRDRPRRRGAASLPTSPAQPIPDTRARAMTLGAPAGSNRLNHRYQVAPAGIITVEFSGLFDVAPPPVVTLEQTAFRHHRMSTSEPVNQSSRTLIVSGRASEFVNLKKSLQSSVPALVEPSVHTPLRTAH